MSLDDAAIIRENEIAKIREGRRRLEIEVAKKIKLFLTSKHLRWLHMLGFDIIDKITRAEEKHGDEVRKFLLGQKPYTIWNLCPGEVGTVEGLQTIKRTFYKQKDGGLNSLSDLVRLFGEMTEALKGHALWAQLDAGKEGLRTYPQFTDQRGQGGFGVHRSRDDYLKKKIYRKAINRGYTEIPRNFVKVVGVERYDLRKDSVIRAIDMTFGLSPVGADISGTTTDSMFVIDSAAHPGPVKKASDIAKRSVKEKELQLLAIATMVTQGHHSLLECAYPLTRWGVMDYRIGFYQTLAPEGSDLEAELAVHDLDMRNRHVLVWFDRGQQFGFEIKRNDPILTNNIFKVRNAYGFCSQGNLDVEGMVKVLESFKLLEKGSWERFMTGVA